MTRRLRRGGGVKDGVASVCHSPVPQQRHDDDVAVAVRRSLVCARCRANWRSSRPPSQPPPPLTVASPPHGAAARRWRGGCRNPLQPPHTTTPTRAAAHALATLTAPQRSATRGRVGGGGGGGGGSGGGGGGAHVSWRRPPRATLPPVSRRFLSGVGAADVHARSVSSGSLIALEGGWGWPPE